MKGLLDYMFKLSAALLGLRHLSNVFYVIGGNLYI